MDLIAALGSGLGIGADEARALAGAALGSVQQHVARQLGEADAAALAGQIPELAQWKALAGALGAGVLGAGVPGGSSGLLGAASGLLGLGASASGGLDVAGLTRLAARAGVAPAAAPKLLPLLLQFLQARLDPALRARVAAAVPALSGAGRKGGLLAALGSILGG